MANFFLLEGRMANFFGGKFGPQKLAILPSRRKKLAIMPHNGQLFGGQFGPDKVGHSGCHGLQKLATMRHNGQVGFLVGRCLPGFFGQLGGRGWSLLVRCEGSACDLFVLRIRRTMSQPSCIMLICCSIIADVWGVSQVWRTSVLHFCIGGCCSTHAH